MKKILMLVLTFTISISLIGCGNKSEKEFVFNYEAKENYSEKIDGDLLNTFFDFTKDMISIYEMDEEEFKKYKPAETLDMNKFYHYIDDKVLEHQEFKNLNIYEEYIIDIMEDAKIIILDLSILKFESDNRNTDLKYGNEPEHNEEYFDEQLKERKDQINKILERVKEYIE